MQTLLSNAFYVVVPFSLDRNGSNPPRLSLPPFVQSPFLLRHNVLYSTLATYPCYFTCVYTCAYLYPAFSPQSESSGVLIVIVGIFIIPEAKCDELLLCWTCDTVIIVKKRHRR